MYRTHHFLLNIATTVFLLLVALAHHGRALASEPSSSASEQAGGQVLEAPLFAPAAKHLALLEFCNKIAEAAQKPSEGPAILKWFENAVRSEGFIKKRADLLNLTQN